MLRHFVQISDHLEAAFSSIGSVENIPGLGRNDMDLFRRFSKRLTELLKQIHHEEKNGPGVLRNPGDPDPVPIDLLQNSISLIEFLCNEAKRITGPQSIEFRLLASVKSFFENLTGLSSSAELVTRRTVEFQRIPNAITDFAENFLRDIGRLAESSFRRNEKIPDKFKSFMNQLSSLVSNIQLLAGFALSTTTESELVGRSTERLRRVPLKPNPSSDVTGNVAGLSKNKITGTLSGFVDKIVPRFYGMMCFKMCIKSIDQCLKKSDQLIKHWEQAFSKTYSKRVEIDENLKKLCSGNLLQDELGLGDSGKVTDGLKLLGLGRYYSDLLFSTYLIKFHCK